MGGINPLGALGAVAGGYMEQANKQRQLAMEEDYKKGLVDQAKLHAKLFEAQAEQAQREGRLLDWAMNNAGRPNAGTQGGLAPMQPSSPEGMGYPGGPRPMMPVQPQAMGGGAPQIPQDKQQVASLIAQEAVRQGVDPNLALKVANHESGFRMVPGKSGEVGIFQLMPGTAREMGVQNPNDPAQNIQGGVGYIRKMLDTFQGNVPMAIAAYNAGPGAIQQKGIINPQYVQAINYQGPGALPQQVAAGQMQQQPQPMTGEGGGGFPGRAEPVLTPEKFMAGYFKKKYGVEMDEVLTKQRPDGGYDFFMKQSGKFLGTQPPTVQTNIYKEVVGPDGTTRTVAVPQYPQTGQGFVSKPPSYQMMEVVDPQTGAKYKIPYNEYSPMQSWGLQPGKQPGQGNTPGLPGQPGQPGGLTKTPVPGFQTEQAPTQKTATVPPEIEKYLVTEIDPIKGQLDFLTEKMKPEYLGLVAQLRAKGLENPYSAPVIRTMEATGLMKEMPPGFLDWYKTLWRLQNKEIHSFAGATMTSQELNRVLMQLTTSTTEEGFKAGRDATMRAADAYQKSVYDYYSKPFEQRAAERAEQIKAESPSGGTPPQATPAQPKRYRYNPATGKVE